MTKQEFIEKLAEIALIKAKEIAGIDINPDKFIGQNRRKEPVFVRSICIFIARKNGIIQREVGLLFKYKTHQAIRHAIECHHTNYEINYHPGFSKVGYRILADEIIKESNNIGYNNHESLVDYMPAETMIKLLEEVREKEKVLINARRDYNEAANKYNSYLSGLRKLPIKID